MTFPLWRFIIGCAFLALAVAHLIAGAAVRGYEGWPLGAVCGIIALTCLIACYPHPGRVSPGHNRRRT